MNGARRPRFRALQRDHIGSVDPHALKIPARRAEYSLTESALSPVQTEPTQPPRGGLFSAKRISFDGLPGSLTEYRYKGDRMGTEFVFHAFLYSTAWRGRLTQMLFLCPDDKASVDRIAPLVRLMANSFVLTSQYE